MRRLWAAVSLVALLAALGLVAGCVESSEEAAQTPSDAPTVANSARQTDSAGEFVTAPAAEEAGGEEGGATSGSATGGAATGGAAPGGGEGEGEAAAGDAAAGEQVFASICTTCHLNNGQEAGGVGPQLAGQGLEADYIAMTIMNGRGAMPPGLVSGADLDNAVAYVLSLQ